MNTEITIVSGLPRSGTSLMMQLLDRGGIAAITDSIRTADTDNPRGYYEFERVKKVKTDAAWLPDARGKVVKMVSQLLYDLPPTEQYKIVFMERNLDEVLDSQEKMLKRLGQSVAPRADMIRAYGLHLTRLHAWLAEQSHMAVYRASYADLVAHPEDAVARLNEFLGGRLDVVASVGAIDPTLYRNRKPEAVGG